jgi:signal transduction histidine kinase
VKSPDNSSAKSLRCATLEKAELPMESQTGKPQIMAPRKKAQAAFASAVMLLFLSGLAGYLTITRLLQSEQWVIHTFEVKTALGDIDWALLRAGRARSGYVTSDSRDFLTQFDVAVSEIPPSLQHLRDLTRDNPREQELCSRLEDVTARRVALLRESIQSRKEAPRDDQAQTDLTRQTVPISSQMTSITEQMRDEEQRLLEIRQKTSHRLFVLAVLILTVAFILSLELFAVHYRFLSAELDAREQAERIARDGETSLRRLTGRLLQLQDAERRKFSRELHDSLGQYLVGAKMNLEMFANHLNADQDGDRNVDRNNDRKDRFIAEAIRLLDQSIGETRTISHLLHPPLLDEVGLSSASKWYVEGFAERSGIEVLVDLPDDAGHLPREVALGLFRVLQESLTNIHRHSNSMKAEVALALFDDHVVLMVRDYGKGIPAEWLESFQARTANSGVGLAGMRERIRELGGRLRVEPCNPGTLITATMPLSATTGGTTTSAVDQLA